MRTPIRVTFAGQNIKEAHVLEWLKEVGSEVREGETVVIVDVEKVEAEIAASVSGKLVEICAPADSHKTVKVVREDQEGDVLGYIEAGNDVSELEPKLEPKEHKAVGVIATPLVRRLADQNGIDITKVKGTGPGGKITRKDLEIHQQQGRSFSSVKENQPESEIKELTNVQTIRAKRMEAANLIPRAATSVEVDFLHCLKLKKEVGLSPFHVVVWAGIQALKIDKYELVNASFLGYNDQGRGLCQKHSVVHAGFSVDPENDLQILVVREASEKSFEDIVKEIRTKTERFLSRGKPNLEDIGGATIVFNNPGVFGSDSGLQIIAVESDRPHAAIIGLGAIKKRPVVIQSSEGEEMMAIRPIGSLEMSWDHRLFGGRLALGFLNEMKKYLEDKNWLK